MLAAILFVFGAANGAMDVAMKRTASRSSVRSASRSCRRSTAAERRGFLAAGLAAVAAVAGVDPRVESLVVAVALWLAALWLTGRLGSASAHSEAGGSRCRRAR